MGMDVGSYNEGIRAVVNHFKNDSDKYITKDELKNAKPALAKTSPEGAKFIEALLNQNLYNRLSEVAYEKGGLFGRSNVEGKVSLNDLHTANRGSGANNGKGKNFRGNPLNKEQLAALKDVEKGVQSYDSPADIQKKAQEAKEAARLEKIQQAKDQQTAKKLLQYFAQKGSAGATNGKLMPHGKNFPVVRTALMDKITYDQEGIERTRHQSTTYSVNENSSANFLNSLKATFKLLGIPMQKYGGHESYSIKMTLKSYQDGRCSVSSGKFGLESWEAIVDDLYQIAYPGKNAPLYESQ